MIATPKSKWTVGMLGSALLLVQPVLVVMSFRLTLQKYGFPLNAESISVVLKDYFPDWLLASLLDLFFLWLALRSYPGQVSLFWHRPERPYWSLSWSVIIGFVIVIKVHFVLTNLTPERLFYLPALIMSVYFLGCIRCGVINSDLFSKPNVTSARVT